MIIHYNIIGCWEPSFPVTEVAGTPDTENLDCVFGASSMDGKWATSNCVENVAGTFGAITFTDTAAKFGSICESDIATPAPEPTTPATAGTSDSTCPKSGITVMIVTLFFCYQ